MRYPILFFRGFEYTVDCCYTPICYVGYPPNWLSLIFHSNNSYPLFFCSSKFPNKCVRAGKIPHVVRNEDRAATLCAVRKIPHTEARRAKASM